MMVLGGQHVSAALVLYYRSMLGGGQPLPRAVTHVQALILRPQTPRRLCRLAAGFHQSLQEQNEPLGINETMRSLGHTCAERKRRVGDPMLTDEELFLVLAQSGLVKASKELLVKDITTLDNSQALEVAKQAVCVSHWCLFMSYTFLLLLRRRTSLSSGARCTP